MSRFMPLMPARSQLFGLKWSWAPSLRSKASKSRQVIRIRSFSSASCTLPGVCAVEFPAISTGRTLVTHASCRFSMATTGYVSYAFLNVGPAEPISNVPFNNLPPFSFSSKGGITNCPRLGG